jgi:hypothetical protein
VSQSHLDVGNDEIKRYDAMIPICLLIEAIAVDICSRLIVDKVLQLAEAGKAKPAVAKSKGASR